MTLVSVQYYRDVTGDVDSDREKIETFLSEAQGMVQEYLQRTLEYGTYTEHLLLWPNRYVYPAAIPLAEVPASASYSILDEATIYNASPDDTPWVDWPFVEGGSAPFAGRRGSGDEARYATATVTVTGGFTALTLPPTIRQAIVKLAQALPLQFSSSSRPAGASSVGVGDVRMSWRAEDTAAAIDQFVPGLTKLLKGYRLDRL